MSSLHSVSSSTTNGAEPQSIVGEPLQPCSHDPKTGFHRTGYCTTGPEDRGRHVVCAEMTEAFLSFTKAQGNDLSTPRPAYNFPGLHPAIGGACVQRDGRRRTKPGVRPPLSSKPRMQARLRLWSGGRSKPMLCQTTRNEADPQSA